MPTVSDILRIIWEAIKAAGGKGSPQFVPDPNNTLQALGIESEIDLIVFQRVLVYLLKRELRLFVAVSEVSAIDPNWTLADIVDLIRRHGKQR